MKKFVFLRGKNIKNEVKLRIEAPVGFEPTNRSFADFRLRPLGYSAQIFWKKKLSQNFYWASLLSGKRDSNPRHQPWQGCALPTELFPLIFFTIFLWTFLILIDYNIYNQNLRAKYNTHLISMQIFLNIILWNHA